MSSNEYTFLSEGFKQLGKLAWLKKGTALPDTLTKRFNADAANVLNANKRCGETRLGDWFGGPKGLELDEEVVGLGSYGFTLTVLSSEAKLSQPDEEEDEDFTTATARAAAARLAPRIPPLSAPFRKLKRLAG